MIWVIAVAGSIGLFLLIEAILTEAVRQERRQATLLRERALLLSANAEVARGKRRSLLAQLLGLVTAYSEHEHEVLERLNAPTKDLDASVTIALVVASASRFPKLRADKVYISLMNQLSTVESELQEKLEQYNSAVLAHNNEAERVSNHWLLKLGGPTIQPIVYAQEFDPIPDLPSVTQVQTSL